MIKRLFLLPMFVYFSSYAQLQNIAAPTDIFMHYRVNSKNGKLLSYDDIKGSAYLLKDFKAAKTSDKYEIILARYNAYTDEVEFKKDNNIYVLPKKNDFAQLSFISSTDRLILITDNNEFDGYYFKLAGKEKILLKKEKVVFIDVATSSNSYESDKPAKFQSQKPSYYLKTDKGIFKISTSEHIISLFPEKKQNLSNFIKGKKIKINNENDLIELVNYLNSI